MVKCFFNNSPPSKVKHVVCGVWLLQLLGQFTREYPGSERTRSNIHIATKLAAYPWRLTPGQFVSACKGSLKRLGADQLTLGQLHWSTAKYAPLQVGHWVGTEALNILAIQQLFIVARLHLSLAVDS
jgi:aryl-alcohol dehydrogenase-like predicted oxidoreductase